MRGSVCGYVVRVWTREPVPGASVLGRGPGARPAMPESWPGRSVLHLAGRTDNAGCFTFDNLREGNWVLWMERPGGEILGEATVRIYDNALSEVTIEVGESLVPAKDSPATRPPNTTEPDMPGSVQGRVVRADNGNPLGDATITVVRGAGGAPDIAPLTDRRGRFALDGLPAGEWVLRALGPGGETGETTVRVVSGSVVDTVIEVGPRSSR
jgi:hypothetical protein